MFILTVILGVALGAMFVMMGAGKLSGKMDEMRAEIGLSEQLWKIDGTTSLLGGAGVLIGLVESLAVLGVLAGVGLVIQTALAVGFHVRRGDEPKQLIPAAMSMLMAGLYVLARTASAG
jgi:uncharacterized membrane protein YphA (DoxX/SURF4 family)